MAFPTVASESSSQQDTNATTHTVTMPTGVEAGDLLVLAWAIDGRENVSGQIPDNWVQIANTAHSGDLASIRVFTKTADGAEGASQSITITTAQCSAHHVWRITGADPLTTPVAAVFQGNVATSFDPPALNPAGWDVEDTLWLALSSSDDGTITVTGFPASYTGTGQVNADGLGDGVTLGYARRPNATASEDPGAFTASASTAWCTVTVGIRPDEAVAPVDAVLDAALGFAASATFTVEHPATMTAALGGTGSLTATRDTAMSASAALGGTAALSATVVHPATAAADLGGTASLAAGIDHTATLAAALGFTANLTADVSTPGEDVDATFDAALGFAATAAFTVEHPAVVVAVLGGTASLVAIIDHPTVLAAPLGGVATLSPVVGHSLTGTADLGFAASLVVAGGADSNPVEVAFADGGRVMFAGSDHALSFKEPQ